MDDAHLTRFDCMRYLAGELDRPSMERLDAHRARCAACGELFDALERIRNRGRAEAPPLEPARPHPVFHRLGWALATALALAGLALVVLVSSPEPGVRSKGGLHVELSCKRGAKAWACRSGERLRPGTAVMIRLALTEDTYLHLIGYDDSGRATVYFPADAERAGRVSKEETDFLGKSLVLDDQSATEHFFLIGAHEPLPTEAVKTAVERAQGQSPEPYLPGASVTHIVFFKDLSQNAGPRPLSRKNRQEPGGPP